MEKAEITQEEAEEAKASQKDTQKEEETQEPQSGQEEKPEQNQEPKKAESEKTKKSIDPKSLQAQKEHYRKKYENALGKLEKYEKSSKESSGKSNKSDLPETQSPMETVKLAKALEGYNEDEIDFIVRNSSGKSPQDIVEATKDEWVKDAISKRREKVEEENKTPEPSSPSSAVKGKSAEDLEKMSDAEYNKFLNENIGKGKRSSV